MQFVLLVHRVAPDQTVTQCLEREHTWYCQPLFATICFKGNDFCIIDKVKYSQFSKSAVTLPF